MHTYLLTCSYSRRPLHRRTFKVSLCPRGQSKFTLKVINRCVHVFMIHERYPCPCQVRTSFLFFGCILLHKTSEYLPCASELHLRSPWSGDAIRSSFIRRDRTSSYNPLANLIFEMCVMRDSARVAHGTWRRLGATHARAPRPVHRSARAGRGRGAARGCGAEERRRRSGRRAARPAGALQSRRRGHGGDRATRAVFASGSALRTSWSAAGAPHAPPADAAAPNTASRTRLWTLGYCGEAVATASRP